MKCESVCQIERSALAFKQVCAALGFVSVSLGQRLNAVSSAKRDLRLTCSASDSASATHSALESVDSNQGTANRNLFNIPSVSTSLSRDKTRSVQRKYFWPVVHKLISTDHSESLHDLDRFWQFTFHSRGETPLPSPSHALHKPSKEFFPGLPTPIPFYSPEKFPELAPFQQHLRTIENELKCLLLCQEPASRLRPHPTLSYLKGWTSISLIDNGILTGDETLHQILPTTLHLLRQLPRTPRGAMFAAQEPRTGIGKHSDGKNFLLTAHLGLDIPQGNIWLEVGGVRKKWKKGEWTILDTSFEHHTWNGTNKRRLVLVVDVWHPALTQTERKAITKLYELRGLFLQEWSEMERRVQREKKTQGKSRKGIFGNWDPRLWF